MVIKLDIIKFNKLLDKLEPTIASNGGRKFIYKNRSLTMNSLVMKFDKIISNNDDPALTKEMIGKIESLDKIAYKKLEERKKIPLLSSC